jgi:comEA protein
MNTIASTQSGLSLPPSFQYRPAARFLRPWLAAWLLLACMPLFASTVFAAETEGPASIRVNINAASVEELQFLPGVGESRAEAIVSLRKERGQFKTFQELLEVKGIGETSLERMEPHLALSGKTVIPQ